MTHTIGRRPERGRFSAHFSIASAIATCCDMPIWPYSSTASPRSVRALCDLLFVSVDDSFLTGRLQTFTHLGCSIERFVEWPRTLSNLVCEGGSIDVCERKEDLASFVVHAVNSTDVWGDRAPPGPVLREK